MSLDEIKAMPIGRLAAEDSVLFMWCVNSMLPEARYHYARIDALVDRSSDWYISPLGENQLSNLDAASVGIRR